MADDLPVLAFPDQEAFEAWLEEHHASEPGLWIRIAKKASGIPTVTAACHGACPWTRQATRLAP